MIEAPGGVHLQNDEIGTALFGRGDTPRDEFLGDWPDRTLYLDQVSLAVIDGAARRGHCQQCQYPDQAGK